MTVRFLSDGDHSGLGIPHGDVELDADIAALDNGIQSRRLQPSEVLIEAST